VYVCNFFKGNEESKKEIKVAPGWNTVLLEHLSDWT
jgi:hypothetical protein